MEIKEWAFSDNVVRQNTVKFAESGMLRHKMKVEKECVYIYVSECKTLIFHNNECTICCLLEGGLWPFDSLINWQCKTICDWGTKVDDYLCIDYYCAGCQSMGSPSYFSVTVIWALC